MKTRRSETVLGVEYLQQLVKLIELDPLSTSYAGEFNYCDSIISNYLTQLDVGYNEQDALVMALSSCHSVMRDLSSRLLEVTRTSLKPTPIITDKEAAKKAGFDVD